MKVVAGWGLFSGALTRDNGLYLWQNNHSINIPPDSDIPGPQPPRKFLAEGVPWFSRLPWSMTAREEEWTNSDPILDFALGARHLVFVTTKGWVYFMPYEYVSGPRGFHSPMRMQRISRTIWPFLNRIEGGFPRFMLYNDKGLARILNAYQLDGLYPGHRGYNMDTWWKAFVIKSEDISFLDGWRIVDIAYGTRHGCALTAEGAVLTWMELPAHTKRTKKGNLRVIHIAPDDEGNHDATKLPKFMRGKQYQKPRKVCFAPDPDGGKTAEPPSADHGPAIMIAAAGCVSVALVCQEPIEAPPSPLPTAVPPPPWLPWPPCISIFWRWNPSNT